MARKNSKKFINGYNIAKLRNWNRSIDPLDVGVYVHTYVNRCVPIDQVFQARSVLEKMVGKDNVDSAGVQRVASVLSTMSNLEHLDGWWVRKKKNLGGSAARRIYRGSR